MLRHSDLEENVKAPGIESWSLRSIFRDYRKVAILGLLTGLIAFVGSFIVPPTYGSSTRVLIRGRDSTLLASSGESLGNQPGVIDSQLAAALTETQAGILSTRSVAIEIVDRLELDAPVDNSGFIGAVRRYGAGTYLRARAYLAHGFYREVERRERMIGQVQGGVGAEQIGDSYVLEIAGLWEEPEIAARIADTAADIMVEQSIERSTGESAAYRDFLSDQVATARIVENQARLAIAEFQNENAILNLDEILALSSRSAQGLDDEIDRGLADLDSLTARAVELAARLEDTERTISSTEQITTGRSTTSIDSVLTNPTYTALDTELQQVRAEAAGSAARLRALELARTNSLTGATGDLSDQEAALRVLLLDLQIAEDSLEELNDALRSATINAQRPQVEVLRLDNAAISTYPLGPKRYLYLAIGLFVGSLMGFLWSFLQVKRREAEMRAAGPDENGPGDDENDGVDPYGPEGRPQEIDSEFDSLVARSRATAVVPAVAERERVPADARAEQTKRLDERRASAATRTHAQTSAAQTEVDGSSEEDTRDPFGATLGGLVDAGDESAEDDDDAVTTRIADSAVHADDVEFEDVEFEDVDFEDADLGDANNLTEDDASGDDAADADVVASDDDDDADVVASNDDDAADDADDVLDTTQDGTADYLDDDLTVLAPRRGQYGSGDLSKAKEDLRKKTKDQSSKSKTKPSKASKASKVGNR